MTAFESSTTIAATPDEVFDYVADRTRELEWNPKCRFVEPLTGGPIGVGSRWRAQWKGSPVIEIETTAFDPPRTITNHNGGPLEVTVTFACAPADGGTRLDVHFEAIPHGFMKLLFPAFARRFRDDSAGNLLQIRRALEK